MKKLFATFLLALSIAGCAGSVELTEFSGSDFSFSYPKTYELRRAATRYVLQNTDGEPALTMYRYLAKDAEEVISQMAVVDQNCKYSKGGMKFGGYKSYKIELDNSLDGAKCSLAGSLITNGNGMLVLFITNDETAEDAIAALKDSFTFAN